jgi:DUF4097 and DUF4098 domain-containing protein YvlB
LKRALQVVGLASVLALPASFALAQETHISREGGAWGEEITGSLAAVKNLRVKVDMGAVVVHGAGVPDISYVIHTRFGNSNEQDARREFEQYKITAYVKGDTAWIVGDWQGNRHPHRCSSEFNVTVPREMALVKLETDGGNVEATSVSGRVEAESGGGGVKLDEIGGGAYAETGGGSIDVGTVSGDLGLHTGGGTIEVHHANGKVKAETGGGGVEIMSAQGADIETGGGSVNLKQCNGKVRVSTGGGSIDLSDVGGPADIETGGGSIHLASAKGYVHAETGGGGIELMGVPSAHAETGAGGITVKLVNTGAERHDSDLETGVGDITVYIASDVALNVRASVDVGNGHRITSEFPDIHVTAEGGDYGPKTYSAEGKLNGGGPTLKVHTSTGDICFKRAR